MNRVDLKSTDALTRIRTPNFYGKGGQRRRVREEATRQFMLTLFASTPVPYSESRQVKRHAAMKARKAAQAWVRRDRIINRRKKV